MTICDSCDHQISTESVPAVLWLEANPVMRKTCVFGCRQFQTVKCTHFVQRQGQPDGLGPDAAGFRSGAPRGSNSEGA